VVIAAVLRPPNIDLYPFIIAHNFKVD